MKKAKALARPRNTLAKRLRNCSTLEERWLLLHTGSPRPTELEHLVYFVLLAKNTERQRCASGSNLTDDRHKGFDQWRANLEHWAGKLLFSIVMKGDVKTLRALADTVGRVAVLNADNLPSRDFLPLALLKLVWRRASPLRVTWRELKTRVADLHGGRHAPEHILRVIKELQIQKLIQIIPTKRGRSRI